MSMLPLALYYELNVLRRKKHMSLLFVKKGLRKNSYAILHYEL